MLLSNVAFCVGMTKTVKAFFLFAFFYIFDAATVVCIVYTSLCCLLLYSAVDSIGNGRLFDL